MDWNVIIIVNSVVLIVSGTLVKIFGSKQKKGCKECFQSMQGKIEACERKVIVLETQVEGIFSTLSEIKANIKEILSLLRGK